MRGAIERGSEKNKARTVQVGREKVPRARRGGRSGEGRGPRTTRRSSPRRQAKNASAPGRLATIRGRIARPRAAEGARPSTSSDWRGSTWQTDRIVRDEAGRRARTWSLESRRRARSRCARARRTREKFGASARARSGPRARPTGSRAAPSARRRRAGKSKSAGLHWEMMFQGWKRARSSRVARRNAGHDSSCARSD